MTSGGVSERICRVSSPAIPSAMGAEESANCRGMPDDVDAGDGLLGARPGLVADDGA